jgi:hypothetical protein
MRSKRSFLTFVLVSVFVSAHSQSEARKSIFLDYTATLGSSQGTIAGSHTHNWTIGKKQKLEAGLGLRATLYLGTKKDFLTAGPAKKTRSSATPFLIFFAGQEEQNFDTLTVQRPLTSSLNLTLNLGYNFSRKWYGGFNIDLIGITFGRKSSAVFTSNGITTIEPDAKPTRFNLLLTGDHDRGTLNSEFFVNYKLTERLALKAVYQFIFIEYKTSNVQQQFSDGSSNDRFRNKANNFGVGIVYHSKN